MGLVAVDKEVRGPTLLVRIRRVLEFILCAGSEGTTVLAAILRPEWGAESRPQNADDNVELRGRGNLRLEVPDGPHRLVFPEVRVNRSGCGEFALKPLHNLAGNL